MMNKVIRVLVVDDSSESTEMFSELLRNQNYEVLTASTGREGLRLAHEARPNLVLLDVQLPDINGIEVCRQIKADHTLPDVFVVILSGHAISAADQVGGLETGADDYLIKGMDAGAFLARIKTTLRLQETAKALRASEERFRQLAENIREVFWLTNPTMDELLYVSPAYETIWARSCKSLYASPRSWLQNVHPADRERIAEGTPTKQISGDYNEEYRIVRPDGSVVWIQDRAFPILDDLGNVYRIAGIAEDITKRKQAEEALRESESRQTAIMQAALDGIITFDQSGRIIELNSSAERMFGCLRAKAIGRDICHVMIPPSLREWFRRGLEYSFAVDEAPILGARIEMSALRADASEFPVECTLTCIHLIGPTLFTAFIRDVTRRKQAEAQMTMLAHAVESTAEPICITDLDDRFIFVNRAFQNTYGYSESEILGKNPTILLSPNNPPFLGDKILESSRAEGWRGEILDRKKDGTEFPVFLSTSKITDRTGKEVGLLGVAQDITERKRAEEQIRLLADAVQSAKDFISITDPENKFVFVNRAFLQAMGYRQEEIIGRKPDFLYSPKNPPNLCETVFQQTLIGSWEGEILNCRKNGMEFPTVLSATQIRDSEGRLIGLLSVAKDISERLWAEKQQAALSQLAYRLSATIEPEEAATVILDIAFELFGWDAGYVDLYSEAEDKLIHVLAVDTTADQTKVIMPADPKQPPTPLMRLVMADGKRLIKRSDKNSIPVKLQSFGDPRRRSESMMYVPIRHRGGALGILSIQSYSPEAYSEEHLKLLQTLADHCGNTVHRMRVATALQEAEAKYRSIFETANEGIFQSSPDGKLLSANPALARIFGYQSPEQFMNDVTDVARQIYVSPEQRDELKRLLNTTGRAEGFEAENYRKDGSKIWISLNAHMARDANGVSQYYEGTIQDITDRKQAQHRLADALELNQTILASSSLGILAYRASGECVFGNEAAARIFHTSVDALLRQNFRHLEFWQEGGLLKLAQETLRTRQVHTAEGRWVDGSNKKIWLDWRLAAFVSGGETHLLALTDDITDRKQAEEELRRLPQLIIEAEETERLRVARDLHDGVNQIIAAAKVKLRKVQDNIAMSSPANGEILSRCNALLVRALEENRRVAYNLRPGDLDEFGFVVACRNFCKEFRSRTNINVRCHIRDFGTRLPPAFELNLFRIVQEAFNNIEKYARAKIVSLGISVRGTSLVLRIRDDGCGFNLKSSVNRRKKRRGIGLTNMRERATSLGGTCTVDSAPKKGTAITIRVPLDEAK